ncbi:MAG: aminomethyltransferase family protein [Halobacteriota archaeon]
MTVAGDLHADHGATFEERGGRRVVREYGRPTVAHRAVRNGVGVIEMGYGVVVVEGDDRIAYVDNVVSNTVPDVDGVGRYALLLDPQGRIESDMYVYNAGERLLLFTPPDVAGPLADDWSEKVFVQDVSIRDASTDFGVFGVHGPAATEKIESVLHSALAPEDSLSFVRGSMSGVGVTVIATDAPTGEVGYEVVCAAADAPDVFSTLLTTGVNAAPFGYQTWDSLTLEAGTPLFEPELQGRIPNVLGLRNALDFQKGCFVGQEVVSKVENRGQPSRRLAGLLPERLPEPGAVVLDDDDAIGEVTRAVESQSLDRPVALALVPYDSVATDLTVRVDDEAIEATVTDLPFVEGSGLSTRLPRYV